MGEPNHDLRPFPQHSRVELEKGQYVPPGSGHLRRLRSVTRNPNEQTPEQLINLFRGWGHKRSPGTREKYARHIEEFAEFLEDNDGPHLADAERLHVIAYMNYLERERVVIARHIQNRGRAKAREFVRDPKSGPLTHQFWPLSAASRRAQYAALRAFYQFLMYLDERRTYDPTQGVERPPTIIEPKEALSEDEVVRLLNVKSTPRERILCWMLAYTAARANEVRNVAWTDIDFERGLIRLRVTKGSKPRTIDIHPALETELRRWKVTQAKQSERYPGMADALTTLGDDYVLLQRDGKQVPKKAIWRSIKARAHRADVRRRDPGTYRDRGRDTGERAGENMSDVSPHWLRRTFATRLREEGRVSIDDIANVTGHKSLDTLRRYYVVASDESRRRAIHAYNPGDHGKL